MPKLQKSYLSIEHKSTFGVIVSSLSNIVYDPSGKFAFSAALHDIHLWNLSNKRRLLTLSQPANDSSLDVGPAPSIVTALALCSANHRIISGHDDGSIKVWNYKTQTLEVTYNGHNNRVTCLTLNHDGTKLASGSFDTDIIVWDLLAQRGCYRLRGHVKPVTNIQFVRIDDLKFGDEEDLRVDHDKQIRVQSNNNESEIEMLLSSSRDMSLKLWELETQHCVQTVVGHRDEVWTFDISKDRQFIVSGGSESEVYVWKIEPHHPKKEKLDDLSDDEKDDTASSVDDDDVSMTLQSDTSSKNGMESSMDTSSVSAVSSIRIRSLGSVPCGAIMGKRTRIDHMMYNAQSNILFAQTNSSMIQIFYCRTPDEVANRLKFRRRKEIQKQKEKMEKMKMRTFPSFSGDDTELKSNVVIKLEGGDYLKGLTPIRLSHRACGMDVCGAMIGLNDITTMDASKESANSKRKNIKKWNLQRSKESKSNQLPNKDDDENDHLDDDDNKGDGIKISKDDAANLNSLKTALSKHDLSPEDVLLQPLLLSFLNNKITTVYVPVPNLTADKMHIQMDEWTAKYLPCYTELNHIEWDGHRTAIRALKFSSDDSMIVSTCRNEVRVWNTRSMKCIRSLPCGYGLQCLFAPGNKHVIVATKKGNILIYDLVTNLVVQKTIAHNGELYAMILNADKTGIITAGADSCIKIWNFNLQMIGDEKQLCIVLTKTVKVQDEVLALSVSPNGLYVAAALLDNTIQIFFADTMKFYLTLYGHKLPVFGMDISSDSTMLVSGSADKNIKIWGMQHGDCMKSLFAHGESVMHIQFVPNTHYFYSCGKDGMIKYWDGDKFRKIQEIEGHFGEIWSFDLNSTGQLLVSAGADRSFRVYMESHEPLFAMQSEREQLEKLFDADLAKETQNQPTAIKGSGIVTLDKMESQRASKKTMNSIDRGEYLLDALQRCDAEMERRKYCKKEDMEYILDPRLKVGGMRSVEEYMFFRFEGIPASDLEEVLMILPFEYLKSALFYLEYSIEHSQQIEKLVRMVLFLVKHHNEQLMASKELVSRLKKLRVIMNRNLTKFRNKIGYNVQAMQYMQDMMNAKARYIREAHRDRGLEIKEKDLTQLWAGDRSKSERFNKKEESSDSDEMEDIDNTDDIDEIDNEKNDNKEDANLDQSDEEVSDDMIDVD